MKIQWIKTDIGIYVVKAGPLDVVYAPRTKKLYVGWQDEQKVGMGTVIKPFKTRKAAEAWLIAQVGAMWKAFGGKV